MTNGIDLSAVLSSARSWIGLGGALVVGHFASGMAMGLKDYWKRFKGSLRIGVLERLVFGTAVAFHAAGIGPLMAGWVGAKMAAGWNLEKGDDKNEADRKDLKERRFAALGGNLVSMACATVGGLIARGTVHW